MVQQTLSPMESVVQYVLDKGLQTYSASGTGGTVREWEALSDLVIKAAAVERFDRAEAHRDELEELRAQRAAGVLDEGQSDYDSDLDAVRVDSALRGARVGAAAKPKFQSTSSSDYEGDCFVRLCGALGVVLDYRPKAASELRRDDLVTLRSVADAMVGYVYYGDDDPRNHVLPVKFTKKSAQINWDPLQGYPEDSRVLGVTSPQHFFNEGNSFYRIRFYADEQLAGNYPLDSGYDQPPGFGGDIPSSGGRGRNAPLPPPESVVNGGLAGGDSNITGGVVRPKRRNIKARSDFMTTTNSLRSYGVSAVTMFNNMEEMYLNTISKEYAQEIVEELFSLWNLPSNEPTVMKYAEDVLWAFMIARTASNKADYKFQIDVPTKSGDVEIDFDVFSRLLANKYGISRRNFARGVADNLRDYLRREENQHLRSLSAQRVGADPQMGDMCFDGSTGCTSLTSSEASFARLLEARNLYERDDVIAEGASDRLMQGMSGGVRSVVPR